MRYALTVETGPRIVVFDVGGVITTTSRLAVNADHVTLAGQTAPGKGIIVQGHPFGLSGASDVIFRHIKTRPGTVSGETIDGMGMAGSNYCIFDRCSMVCPSYVYIYQLMLVTNSQVLGLGNRRMLLFPQCL